MTDYLSLAEALNAVETFDAAIDAAAAPSYRDQPLALDWARITKVCEESGEAWRALSAMTGENPRKGTCGTQNELLAELGDCVSAAMGAIQHITKDTLLTWTVISAALVKARTRAEQWKEAETGAV